MVGKDIVKDNLSLKGLAVLVILLFVMLTISQNTIGDISSSTYEHPPFYISDIYGGYFINAEISNIADYDLKDVKWHMSVSGGYLSLIDRTKTGTIDTIPMDEIAIVRIFVLGFGNIKIKIDAIDSKGDSNSGSEKGRIIGFYTII